MSLESILTLAKDAVAANKGFSINLSAPFIVQFFGEQLSAVIPYADFIFANESEAAAFGKFARFNYQLVKYMIF